MTTDDGTPGACPECHAANPWIYENDEYNCRNCGYVRTGYDGAKLRDEGEYTQPLTEIYLKNPVHRSDRPLSTHLQKVESDMYRQLFGYIHNTLNLPETIAQRAWNVLGIVRKKHSKLRLTQSVKNLAMCTALYAAREAGHEVSELPIAAMIGKDITYIANELQLICKTLGKPYADVRGVNEYTQHVIRVVDEIAPLFINEIGLAEGITDDKYFKNIQEFCAAYKPHIDAVYGLSQRVERLGEVTGVWQNRTPDFCAIASVFIGLELASGMYQHQTRLITDEIGQRLSVKTHSWLPRTREIQRVTMDLAFYLPQIGKARIIPELVAPWHGSTARPLPIGQVFILLLPDVLDNMDALWEKREKDLERGMEADSKRDVEARLKEAISAFLPSIADEELANDSEVDGQDRRGVSAPQGSGAQNGNENAQQNQGSPLPPSQALRSRSPSQGFYCAAAATGSDLHHPVPLPPLPCDPSSVVTTSHPGIATISDSEILSSDRGLKRKHPDSKDCGPKQGTCNDPEDPTNPDSRKKSKRRAVPLTERQKQLEIRKRFEQRLTEKHSQEVARQRSQRQAGIGLKNADGLKPGRRIYGRKRYGLSYTGDFQRLPTVMQYLRQWQSREMSLQNGVAEAAGSEENTHLDDGAQLRQDLRRGVDPSLIPEFRFPTSLALAKAMLADTDVNLPDIGPDDDMYFDEGELDAYFGDEHYQKVRLELWNANGYDNFVSKDTVYSERALEIAATQDSRVADLTKRKPKRQQKLNTAKFAALMETFREDSEDLQEIDPVLRKVFGRSVAQVAMQADDPFGSGVEHNHGDGHSKQNEFDSEGDAVEEEETELGELADDSSDGASKDAHLYPDDDNAFEVVGDLDDYRG